MRKTKGRTDTSFNILISKTIDIEHYSKTQTYDRDVSNKIHSLRRRSMIQSKQMWVEKIDTLSKVEIT